jgi:cytochrome c peroxidase
MGRRWNMLVLALALVSWTCIEWHTGDNWPFYFPDPVTKIPASFQDSLRAELGRALFYDPILSLDSTISCASCHSPFNAFAHSDHALSHGIFDSMGVRNAPALFNLAWNKQFMWDGAINHIDMQAIAPITHPDEMGETMENVIVKLKNSVIYNQALAKCWPNESWQSYHLLKALSLFQLSLISDHAKYDAMRRGEVEYSEIEKLGYQVFKQHCNQCHREPLFTTGNLDNNGLPLDTSLNDLGAFEVLRREDAKGQFKIPSLRNWAFTKPYMHDGRFQRMQQVVQHYRNGPFNAFSSNQKMRKRLVMSDDEVVELMAFLKTLNDSAFVFKKEHQYPHNYFQ